MRKACRFGRKYLCVAHRLMGWLGGDTAAPGGQEGADHHMETPLDPQTERDAGREDLRGPRVFKLGTFGGAGQAT